MDRRSDEKPAQHSLPFGGADQDAQVEFRQRMNSLRENLKRIEPEAAGLSGLRWDQLREMMMATKSYELAGRQPELSGLLRTSGLTRNQWYVARQNALALGLVKASRRYESKRRNVDYLSVDHAAVDELARGPTNAYQHRSTPTKREQRRPTQNSSAKFTNPRAPGGAAKDLPLTSSPAAANEDQTTADPRAEKAAAAEEKFNSADWDEAFPIANRLLKILAPDGLNTIGRDLREWIAKVAILAVRFGPSWIDPAFERLKNSPSRNPKGLIATILDDECQRLRTRFNREMARVEPPPNLMGKKDRAGGIEADKK